MGSHSRRIDEDDYPSDGQLPAPLFLRLARLLESFTLAPRVCWFGLWDGYGGIDPWREWPSRLVLPHGRYMILFRGPLHGLGGFGERLPNIWRPEDRSWLVASDIDDFSTFLGGSSEAIDSVLNDPVLEALPTRVEAKGDSGPHGPPNR